MSPTAAATRVSGCNQLPKRAGGKENSDQRMTLHRYQDTCETMCRGKGAGNDPFMGRVVGSRLCQNENATPFYLGWPPLNMLAPFLVSGGLGDYFTSFLWVWRPKLLTTDDQRDRCQG